MSLKKDNYKSSDKKIMNFAIRLAENNKYLTGTNPSVGCVIVKNNKIISEGFNEVTNKNDPTAHAEIIAISSATNTLKDWRLSECSLYVTKEPCPMCAGAIINSRLNFVGFGAYDEKEGCCGSLYQLCGDPRFKTTVAVKGGILEKKCLGLLQEFFQSKRSLQ